MAVSALALIVCSPGGNKASSHDIEFNTGPQCVCAEHPASTVAHVSLRCKYLIGVCDGTHIYCYTYTSLMTWQPFDSYSIYIEYIGSTTQGKRMQHSLHREVINVIINCHQLSKSWRGYCDGRPLKNVDEYDEDNDVVCLCEKPI